MSWHSNSVVDEILLGDTDEVFGTKTIGTVDVIQLVIKDGDALEHDYIAILYTTYGVLYGLLFGAYDRLFNIEALKIL